MLAAIVDGKFVVWYYPNVVYIDRNLVTATRSTKDGRYLFLSPLPPPSLYPLFLLPFPFPPSPFLPFSLSLLLIVECSDFGKTCQLSTFFGNMCTGRRADGALISASVSPYPILLYQYVERNEWESAIRLCRFVKVILLLICYCGTSFLTLLLGSTIVVYIGSYGNE